MEGDREQEILEAALDELAEVGYDRLTMDAVARRAKASKATLYRRWHRKSALVIDAMISQKEPAGPPPDTGSLREDLIAVFCGPGHLADSRQTDLLASVITAIARDEEFAKAFRERFIAPKAANALKLYQRAQARGEIADDVDLEILTAALPGIILHRHFLLGEQPTPERIIRVIDQVIIPAATSGRSVSHPEEAR